MQLVRPARSWCTFDEWWRIASRGRDWSFFAARKALFEMKKDLARANCTVLCRAGIACSCGRRLVLLIQTPKETGVQELHVATPAIVAFLEEHLLDARREDERFAAQADEREPEDIENDVVASEVAADYRVKSRPLSFIRRKYGLGYGRVVDILKGSRVELRGRGRRPIEDVRPAEVVARALATFDRDGTVRGVALVLLCSRRTAARFLERHGRKLPPGEDGSDDRGTGAKAPGTTGSNRAPSEGDGTSAAVLTYIRGRALLQDAVEAIGSKEARCA